LDPTDYAKITLPIFWIKELISNNLIFEEDKGNKKHLIIFIELIIGYICSNNTELYLSAFKILIDQLFSIEIFISSLEDMQLIDNDDLKELHKKVDIITRSISTKVDNLDEYKKEEDYILLIS